jgi:hypothetical protein
LFLGIERRQRIKLDALVHGCSGNLIENLLVDFLAAADFSLDGTETPVDRGPPKRRSAETPIPAYTGLVEMKADDLDALKDLSSYAFIRIKAPDTGKNVIVRFYSEPFFRKATIIVGKGIWGNAEIKLAINPAATKLEES